MSENQPCGSLRDPNGVVFCGPDGQRYRQINRGYEPVYRQLAGSGLYAELTEARMLAPHDEVSLDLRYTDAACAVLRPWPIPFISYPYEWCFSQFKDAALLTLDIQKRALKRRLSLKDASACNIQFDGTAPLFMNMLSFEEYQEGTPWAAYGQFCRHFLAPLVLMARRDMRLGRLTQVHLDGIPLDLADRLMPWHTWFVPGMLKHIHLHARRGRVESTGQQSAAQVPHATAKRMRRTALCALVDSLESTIRALTCPQMAALWSDYYRGNTHTADAEAQKSRVVAEFLDRLNPRVVWDLSANTGLYSRLASGKADHVVAFDADWACVEQSLRLCREDGIHNVLPLWLDLTNPSPALGWAHAERQSLVERAPADVLLALTFVHRLALGNHVPLERIAALFVRLGRTLIIEFVPKEDPEVWRFIEGHEERFRDYGQTGFEAAFRKHFRIEATRPLPDSGRVLYLMAAAR